jgi:23S rRNA U2552 (ribose-2'-O)-methylase RlmE/FtsJ
MVKKYVFKLTSFDDNDEAISISREQLLSLNERLHNELILQKNNITSYHRKRKWEKYKKLSNDYELIYSTNTHFPSISSYHPLSRSYFKLWEILTDLPEAIRNVDNPNVPIRTAFLADAPGGFVQAFAEFRRRVTKRNESIKDESFAISLRPSDIYTPQWKLSQSFCEENNIELVYGSTDSGDLCDPRVVDSFVSHVGAGSCDLVTADGGFDFSSDFNCQEEMSTNLITAEIGAAMRLQKQGGSFVLKIYDMRTTRTMTVLHKLVQSYDEVRIFKPLSSRPANSEKYIIASGFKGFKGHTDHTDHTVTPLSLLHKIVEYNAFYVSSQIACICKTIKYIHAEKTQRDVCKTQLNKAIKWCHKYSIPINIKALQSYKIMYTGI